MQEIYINNKKSAISFKNKNFNELISSLKTSLNNKFKSITDIKINGLAIDLLSNSIDIPSHQIQKIEVTIQDSHTYLADLLTHGMSIIDQTMSIITEDMLRNDDYSRYYLKKVLDAVDIFVQIIIKIHKTVNLKDDDCITLLRNMKACEMHLFSVVKAIQHAAKKEDSVMICDLLEHELTDNLKQWKINIVPQLKLRISTENS